MKQIKGMTNDNKAEEHMRFDEDIIGEIISRLPANFAIQCKILSQKLKGRISDPNFSQLLFQHHKNYSTQLIYSTRPTFDRLYKISLNPTPITQCSTYLSHPDIELVASCNGLILLGFEELMVYCIFNPTIGEYQLISYPESTYMIGYTGLAVDYPSLDQYKLVMIKQVVENFNRFYKFHVISSKKPGIWREIRMGANTSISLSKYCAPVYWRNSLYWLRSDNSVLSFDTKKEEGALINRPHFIDHFDLNFGKIFMGRDKWLGVAQGLLTLVSIFKKCIVICTYNDASNNWIVSNILDNFVLTPYNTTKGFPVFIDIKEVVFMVSTSIAEYHMFEYDTKINGYKKVHRLHILYGDRPMYCFHPTLASVHKTPSNNVTIDGQVVIDETLNNIKRFIIEGISTEESSSSEESSSEEDEDDEEEENLSEEEEEEEE